MKAATTFLCLFLLSFSYAQSQAFEFKSWGVEDGLSNPVIRNIAQDPDGFIWIATEHGLNRFDGKTFKGFYYDANDTNSLSHNTLFGLAVDGQGSIWVGSDFGLNRYDPSSDLFKHFKNDPTDSFSLSNNYVRAVFVDSQNRIWAGTQNGLNLFRPESQDFWRLKDHRVIADSGLRKNISYNRINTITEDGDSKIWVGTDGGGVKIYSDTSYRFEPFFLPDADGEMWRKRIVRTIYQDHDGVMWFGTDMGLGSFDPTAEEYAFYYTVSSSDGLSNQFVWGVLEAQDFLWISTYRGGINLMNPGERKIVAHLRSDKLKKNTLSSDMIWPLFKDREGNVWAGADGVGGLNFYSKRSRKFHHYLSEAETQQALIVCDLLEIDDQTVLVSTDQGLFKVVLGDGQYQSLFFDHFDETNFVRLASYNGSILLLEGNQVLRVNRSLEIIGRTELRSFKPETLVWSSTLGSDNQLWIGSVSQGLVRYNPETFEETVFLSDGNTNIYQDSRSISSTAWAMGRLWVGSVRSGLFEQTDSGFDQFLYHTDDFFEPTISAIAVDHDGFLWLGTLNDGLIRFDPKTKEYRVYQDDQYRLTNEIVGVLVDRNGVIWLSSKNGLGMFEPAAEQFHPFTREDGVQSRVFDQGCHQGKSGRFYFGGANGFNTFFPEQVTLNQITPEVMIESVLVDGEEMSTTELGSLSYLQNNLEVSFVAPHFVHPEQSKYQYKIGQTDFWTDVADEQKIRFSRLATGTYNLQIRGSNNDGVWGKPTNLFFRINPPWWRSWWFQAAVFTGCLVLAYSLYSYRIYRANVRQKELETQVAQRTEDLRLQRDKAEQDRETIADQKELIEQSLKERETLLREIHHRVKNNLQVIANLLYLQSGSFEDEKIKDLLEEGQGRVRSMSLIHQKLYENDDLKNIPFGEYIAELVNDIQVSFGESAAEVEVGVSAPEIYFDVDAAVPLGLIINELVTNAFKYAFSSDGKGVLSISISNEGSSFLLNVSDNGQGLPPHIDINRTKSLGLRLVRILSQQLEGAFEFENNGGFRFNLRFSINI